MMKVAGLIAVAVGAFTRIGLGHAFSTGKIDWKDALRITIAVLWTIYAIAGIVYLFNNERGIKVYNSGEMILAMPRGCLRGPVHKNKE